jgi:hypothetical protein
MFGCGNYGKWFVINVLIWLFATRLSPPFARGARNRAAIAGGGGAAWLA